jgi:hypothetical protein
MKSTLFAFGFLFWTSSFFAQKSAGNIRPTDFDRLTVLEDSLAFLAKIVVQDTLSENRLAAQEKLLPMLRAALAIPNSFNFAFSKVENIAIQKPSDGSFRILTWQLFEDEDHYRYFGFVQLNRSKPTVYELVDNSKKLEKPERLSLSPQEWYGALYYNITAFKTKEGMKYLLFGYNANDRYERIKVCDVLILSNRASVERGGILTFGAPVFEVADIQGRRPQKFHRLILNYSAEASLRLNYDTETGLIVHDHLQEMGTQNPNYPLTYVPDGTYEAFELKKAGYWAHIDKLPTHAMDEAPRPVPKERSRNRVKQTKADAQKFEWPEDAKKQKND